VSDQPGARIGAAGESAGSDSSHAGPGSGESGASGPYYGPVHRYGRPPDALRDGPPSVLVRTWAQPGPVPPPGWGDSPPEPRTSAHSVVALARSEPRRNDHASWSRRVGASLLDSVPGLVAAVLLVAGYLPTYLGFFRGDLTVAPRYPLVLVGSLLSVVALGLAVCNRYVLAGRTGQSVGKRVTGIWLVSRTTGRPIGTLDAFVRDLLHVLDGIGYVGYLWPLWDDERQTLADKVAQTVVVRTPVAPLTAQERRPD